MYELIDDWSEGCPKNYARIITYLLYLNINLFILILNWGQVASSLHAMLTRCLNHFAHRSTIIPATTFTTHIIVGWTKREFSNESTEKKWYILDYDYPADVLTARTAHRPFHLKLAKQYIDSGMLILGGAVDPPTNGILVFSK